mmetsp:Transcript_55279/g.120468  ORF Transcript_55279/g.120468 Transcript_55279/m.120468 type:complete len:404 (+) Transcript_55279:297-1508(+)
MSRRTKIARFAPAVATEPPVTMPTSEERSWGRKRKMSSRTACWRLKRTSLGNSRLPASALNAMKTMRVPKGIALRSAAGIARRAKTGIRAGTILTRPMPNGSESMRGSRYARHARTFVPTLLSVFSSPDQTTSSGSLSRRSAASLICCSRWAISASRLFSSTSALTFWNAWLKASLLTSSSESFAAGWPGLHASTIAWACASSMSRSNTSLSWAGRPATPRPAIVLSPMISFACRSRCLALLSRSISSTSALSCAASSAILAAWAAAFASSTAVSVAAGASAVSLEARTTVASLRLVPPARRRGRRARRAAAAPSAQTGAPTAAESCCKAAGAAGAPRSRAPVAARGARVPAGCETTNVWGEAQPAAASAISAARTLTSCTASVLAIAVLGGCGGRALREEWS